MGHFNLQEEYDSGYDPAQDATAVLQIKPRGAAVRKDALLDDVYENKVLDNSAKQGAGSGAGSSAQGSSANGGGSEAGTQSVASGAAGHDEELAVDSRCARLWCSVVKHSCQRHHTAEGRWCFARHATQQ